MRKFKYRSTFKNQSNSNIDQKYFSVEKIAFLTKIKITQIQISIKIIIKGPAANNNDNRWGRQKGGILLIYWSPCGTDQIQL